MIDTGGRARSTRAAIALGGLLLAGVFTLGVSRPAYAEGDPTAAVAFRLGAQARSADRLGVGETRPVSRGEIGGRLEVGMAIGESLEATLSGHVGGSWFNFDGPGFSGNVTETIWDLRAGIDRRIPIGARSAFFVGPGLEYGKGRSRAETQAQTIEGPRSEFIGGSIRTGVSHAISERLELRMEAIASVYRANAHAESTGDRYDWIGRSTGFVASVGYVIRNRGSATETTD